MKTKEMYEIYNFSLFWGFWLRKRERKGGWLLNYLAYTDLTFTVLNSSSNPPPPPSPYFSFQLVCPSPKLVVSTKPFYLNLGSARLLGSVSWFCFLFCCLMEVYLKTSSNLLKVEYLRFARYASAFILP